jgi:hypothetical protein
MTVERRDRACARLCGVDVVADFVETRGEEMRGMVVLSK